MLLRGSRLQGNDRGNPELSDIKINMLQLQYDVRCRKWGNTPDGISKGSPDMFGISVPPSKKKFVTPNDSLPKFPPRECLANLRKTCDNLIHCWPLERIGMGHISGEGF
jgi:hypothetical protein